MHELPQKWITFASELFRNIEPNEGSVGYIFQRFDTGVEAPTLVCSFVGWTPITNHLVALDSKS